MAKVAFGIGTDWSGPQAIERLHREIDWRMTYEK